MPDSPAARLAEFAVSVDADVLPLAVVNASKLHLLDVLGCALAASALGSGDEGRLLADDAGASGHATVIGSRSPRPPTDAALANGMLAHALDFDDTHPDSICHISAVVAPAALAEAEAAEASGADLVAALVAGSELVARVGTPAASRYMQTGFHPTSVSGVFGAVAAGARARGAGAAVCRNALGIAGSMASGVFEYLADGSATKPIHTGWAAHAGVTALRLAAAGAEGPGSVLEGRFGFYASYYGLAGVDLEPQLGDLGERWETPRIAYKPYPACHFVHSCIDAAARALGAPVPPEEIEEVVLAVPAAAVPLVLEPADAKVAPRSDYDAKFSLPYSVAAMIVDGRVGVETYAAERLDDERILAVARRVRYEVRDFGTGGTSFPGAVSIRLAGGRTVAAEVPHQRGGSENPMSRGDVVTKFRENAALALDPESVELLERAVLALEDEPTLDAFRVLGRAATPAIVAA